VDVNEEGLDATQQAIESRGAKASVHVADVSSSERMAELPDEVMERHGACHVLVNNAGVLTVGRFADEELDESRWVIGINVYGMLYGCHHFLPVLLEQDEAHIVNVSSMAAFAGIPQNAVYSLTKGAVRSFTEALRSELIGTNVGVSALFPGGVDTNIMHTSRGAQSAQLSALAKRKFVRYLGSSPEGAGRKIVQAIDHNKARVLLGPDARALDITARILPGRTALLGRVLDRITR